MADGTDDAEWRRAAELRLVCVESLTTRRATVECVQRDSRVLRRLQLIDDRYVVSSNPYVDGFITVHMRTQLAEWIYEVTTTLQPCHGKMSISILAE